MVHHHSIKDLCSWQDSFPYTQADDIFLHSNCTYKIKIRRMNNETQKGPLLFLLQRWYCRLPWEQLWLERKDELYIAV